MEIKSEKLTSLKNNGNLEVFFIGVGSAFALKHSQTNFLIIKGDKHVMVDFGMTGPQALAKSSTLTPNDIEVVLPTHSHDDHVCGIGTIALMNRYIGQKYMGKKKTKMIINEEYQRTLWTHTLQGSLEFNEVIGEYNKMQFSDYFDVIRPTWKTFSPRETWEINVGDIHLEMFRTTHIPEQGVGWETSFISYGLFIDNRVFVSCDTKFDLDLLNIYADKSEVMFHDVQFFPGAVHAPLSDLQTLPSKWKEKMYLIHYADNYLDPKYNNVVTAEFAGWTQEATRYIFA